MWQFSVSFLTVCVSLWSFCISLWLSCLWMRSFFICLVILNFYTALQYLHVVFFFCLIVVVLCPFSLPSHPLPITGNPVGGNCGENDIFITSLLSIGVLYSLVYHWYEFTYILSNLTTQISTDMKRDHWMKYKPTYFQCATSLCDPQGRWVALNISRIVWHIVSRLTAHPPLSDLRRKKKALMFFKLSLPRQPMIPPFIWRHGNLSKHDAERSGLIDDLLLLIKSLTCGLAIVAHVVNQ